MKKKFEKIGKPLNKGEQKKIAGQKYDQCNSIPCLNPMTGQFQCNPIWCYCNDWGSCSYYA
jgi:hypothetical protein